MYGSSGPALVVFPWAPQDPETSVSYAVLTSGLLDVRGNCWLGSAWCEDHRWRPLTLLMMIQWRHKAAVTLGNDVVYLYDTRYTKSSPEVVGSSLSCSDGCSGRCERLAAGATAFCDLLATARSVTAVYNVLLACTRSLLLYACDAGCAGLARGTYRTKGLHALLRSAMRDSPLNITLLQLKIFQDFCCLRLRCVIVCCGVTGVVGQSCHCHNLK